MCAKPEREVSIPLTDGVDIIFLPLVLLLDSMPFVVP